MIDPKTRGEVTEHSPGKINLVLAVHGKRSDGFHDLDSFVMGVGLSDTLHFALDGSESEAPQVSCDNSSIPSESNLVTRAIILMAERHGLPANLSAFVQKRIPLASGLGGGSANAAATLRACNLLWGLGLTDLQLAELGSELGSDVPLFFSLPSAQISGRGERVTPVAMNWSGWVVIAHAPIPVSTAEAYAAWQAESAGDIDPYYAAIRGAGSAGEIQQQCRNDLAAAVRRVAPNAAAFEESLSNLGLGSWAMTGAGATFFRLYDDYDLALEAHMKVMSSDLDLQVFLVRAPVREETQ
ncbi:MAG: 4-(cytidine 5'-diphospho)-2-C-methyl-D-erythritol kinase [Planctomycetota bacterium]